MIKERVIPHFAHPKGPLGWLAGRIMSTRDTNVERNQWVAEILAPAADAKIIEIGHGPGLAIADLWPKLTSGKIVGVEISELMSRTAARRNRAGVEAGTVEFRVADSAKLPADLVDFDIIFGVNSSMFWDDPGAAVVDLAQRLAPGGELVLTYMTPPTASETPEAVAEILAGFYDRAGLIDIERQVMESDPPAIATRGRRPKLDGAGV